MPTDIFATAAQLRADGTPFVLATVVASYPPQSVRPGAKAIVHADGAIDGWIGGGCVRPVVVQEALDALEERRPRLVRMNPATAETNRHGDIREYAMTCQGEGGVEIYLEPVLPAERLVVLGHTPVALALARLGIELGFDVIVGSSAASCELMPNGARVVGDARIALAGAGASTWVVVATMGVSDEDALIAAAESDASYVGLVASKKKGRYLADYARASGVPAERVDRVKFPAGLDFGATTPSEIALSILAEIEQRKHQRPGLGIGDSSLASPATRNPGPGAREPAVPSPDSRVPSPDNRVLDPACRQFPTDPICGMPVDPAAARHTLIVGGETVYFCCPHCKATYVRRLAPTQREERPSGLSA